MTVKLTDRKTGKDKCPDWPRIVEALNSALVPTFWNILEDVIGASDGTVILEFYAALAARWDRMSDDERALAAGEGEERYFTVEAFERDHLSRVEAQSIVQMEKQEGGRLWTPQNGGGH